MASAAQGQQFEAPERRGGEGRLGRRWIRWLAAGGGTRDARSNRDLLDSALISLYIYMHRNGKDIHQSVGASRSALVLLPLYMRTYRCPLVGICTPVRITAALLCVVQQPAGTSMPSPSESVAPGLHGLSAVERYYFETQGFVVIPDIIPGQLLAELNAVNVSALLCTTHVQ
eukprot:COSAG02_NODE_1549_length_11966_cov_3.777282_9_plen_172_part_00